MTRRRFLGSLAGGAALLGTSACAPPVPPAAAATTRALPADRSATDKKVAFGNWGSYLDVDEASGRHPTLDAFTKATGIAASYTEDIDDNDVYYNKIAPQLRAGQDIGRDVVVFSDWMVNRVIAQDLVQPLELIRMPHAGNVLPGLMDAPFDPGRQYSLPWQSGLTGIGYDKSKTGPIKSVDDLWRADLKGRVVGLTEYRDTLGLILLAQGVDPSKPFSSGEFERACEVVDKQLSDGQIRRIKGGSYTTDLQSGNAVAGIVWSGDIITLRNETGNDNWEFVIPESGGMLWSDNMVIPATSPHRRNAELLMDWYYRPEIAAQVAAYVNYVCPVAGAQQAMEKIDLELVDDPLIFPSDELLAKQAKVFRPLSAAEEQTFSTMWSKVVGA